MDSRYIFQWVVSRVCALGYSVIHRGANSRTAASFLRACIANAFITIASLSSPLYKIQLYIEVGLIALLVNSLHQVGNWDPYRSPFTLETTTISSQ